MFADSPLCIHVVIALDGPRSVYSPRWLTRRSSFLVYATLANAAAVCCSESCKLSEVTDDPQQLFRISNFMTDCHALLLLAQM